MTKDQAIQRLHQCQLYAILDTGYSTPAQWPQLTAALIQGGVGAIQIRAKQAAADEITRWSQPVLALCTAAKVPLIINDHPDIARQLGAAGCHVGQDDASIAEVKKITGNHLLVGKSTHSLRQAEEAQAEGADYIGFGPIFATATKPDYQPIGPADIRQMAAIMRIPHFCIGGIKLENVAGLRDMGAQRVVIVSGLLQSPNPTQYAKAVCQLLGHDSSLT